MFVPLPIENEKGLSNTPFTLISLNLKTTSEFCVGKLRMIFSGNQSRHALNSSDNQHSTQLAFVYSNG
jgi:hypothetical protein